jgi:hypothetical protein
MSESMEIYPEYEELMNQILKLKNELSQLLLERDELVYHICVNIESEYMLKIGVHEYKLLMLQYDILKIKRKIELIQAKINRQEAFSLALIEQQIEYEFTEYIENLNERMKKINDALKRREGDRLSTEDTAELKRLYRQIVKKLHPDLNPNYTLQQKELFLNATSAYKNGDLEALQAISLLVDSSEDDFSFMSGVEEMYYRKSQLEEKKEALNKDIEKIKSSFPYNQRELLSNEKLVTEKVNQLMTLIEENEEIYKKLEERLQALLGG